MKRYIKSATVEYTAKTVADAVEGYLTDLGIQGIRYLSTRRRGMTGKTIVFTMRFEEYTKDKIDHHINSLMTQYPDEYPDYQLTYNFVKPEKKNIEYRNFVILSELYGNSTEGDYHDPFSHSGSEYTTIGKGLLADIQEFVQNSGFTLAIVELGRSGLYGIYQDIKISIYVPKET